jgi:hypothetical protein
MAFVEAVANISMHISANGEEITLPAWPVAPLGRLMDLVVLG